MSGAYNPDPAYFFPRDFRGYGEPGIKLQWPNNAKIAVSFVINYEEGGERNVMHGDAGSEISLKEKPGPPQRVGERDLNGESEYEYGSRAGFWRLFRLFNKHNMKYTLYAVAKAIDALPEVATRSVALGHDVASHAYRWVDYHDMPVEQEKEWVRKAVTTLKAHTGYAPRGWFYGRGGPRSRALVPEVYEEMGEKLEWWSDTYADDVPYWIDLPAQKDKGLLMVPYSYDCNDFKFMTPGSSFVSAGGFLEHIKNAFDTLYEEGRDEGTPKMMTVALHCRIMGRPGRFRALKEFVEYISQKEGVWVATRSEIADAFRQQYPYRPGHLA